MILGINQPTFFPWLGYFNMLRESDTFVFLDNVQCVKQSYIVRTKVMDSLGNTRWISADLAKHPLDTSLNRVKFVNRHGWCLRVQRKVEAYYRNAPFYPMVCDDLFSVLNTQEDVLSEYNITTLNRLYKWIFGESLNFVRSSMINGAENSLSGALQRVLTIIDHFKHVSKYLNFKTGIERGLYPAEIFRARGISLQKQEYLCRSYHQSRETFFPGLSIIDLIMNEPQSRWAEIIMSGQSWDALC